MENLVGKEIWLVNYGCVEFQDGNGVYSTREKAEAAVLAIESKRAIYDVDIKALQKRLTEVNVLVHFPDELVPEDKKTELSDDEGHF
jgi:hypothetical protein